MRPRNERHGTTCHVGRVRRVDVVRSALSNRQLRRVLLAFLIFNVAWWANWIAVLVWAYGLAGASGAAAIALAQLVPSAVLASPAATYFSRWPRPRALNRGYLVQAVTYVWLGTSLVVQAHVAVICVAAVLGGLAITLTRPVHNSLLPQISRNLDDLTVGNSASGALEASGLVVGPLTCGLTIVLWGPGGVVLLMATATVVSVLATARVVADPAMPVTAPARARASEQLRLVLRNPAARVLSAMVLAESTLIGMLDIFIVVLALDRLDMAESGPGILNTAIGLGGLIGAGCTIMLVGRRRLSPALIMAGLWAGLPFALAGLASSALAAGALLLLCGAGKAAFEVTGRTFLQRVLPDHLLNAVFGLQESIMMTGFAAGTLAAPLLVAAVGVSGAFLAGGLFLPLVTVVCWSALCRLDERGLQPSDVIRIGG